MKCFTANVGVVSEGIRLHRDPPSTPDGTPRYFVHVSPDHFGEVRNVEELLTTGCARKDGDDIVVLRCRYVAGDLLPEREDEDAVLVLGAVDYLQTVFPDGLEEPAEYRTALGVNLCFQPLVTRHRNREMGRTTGHEQYGFLGIFNVGDCIEANVIFEDTGGQRLDLWADGPLLSYDGGEPVFHLQEVVRQSERFSKRS